MNTIRRLLYQLSRRWRQRNSYPCGLCDGAGTVMQDDERHFSWTFCGCCDGEGRHRWDTPEIGPDDYWYGGGQ